MSTPEPACRPHVNAGNDYWFDPSDRERGRGETRREQLDRVTMARAICHGCPLAATCIEVAVTRGFKTGIWLTDEGADQGAVAREVAAWFTDLYGHPLTKREAADAREFLAMVTDRMEATR